MPFRSHVDPSIYIRYMHVHADQVSDETMAKLSTLDDKDASLLLSAYSQHFLESPRTLFHESYHFWQGLRLPFLYRYATLSFRAMFLTFRELVRHSNDFETWECSLPELYRLELPGYLWGFPGVSGTAFAYSRSEKSYPQGHTKPALVATPLTLMENAASLAEFEVFGQGESTLDPLAFKRWEKRHPSYTDCIKYVSQVLGDEALAIRAFIPLVNAAFETSDPVRGFAELLQRLCTIVSDTKNRDIAITSNNFLAWHTLFEHLLDDIEFEAELDADAEILSQRFFRLSLTTWIDGSFGDLNGKACEHPTLPTAAREWERLSHFPEMKIALDHPGALTSRSLDLISKKFYPPLTFARFHSLNGKDRVLIWGNTDLLSDFFRDEKEGLLLDFLSLYSAVRRASGAHFDADHRLCYHASCPHYGPNYCNSYPSVPRFNFESCKFPMNMANLLQYFNGDS